MDNIIKKHIANGVVFKSTYNLYIGEDVVIKSGAVIYPCNYIDGHTVIGKNCVIDCGNILENAILHNGIKTINSIIRNSEIGTDTTIGPYANIHSNSKISKDCRIGNFVEVKNSTIGIATKAAHLAYIGDADIGNLCNVGCGAIFVNYDGKNKHRSSIGDSVFVGSNSNIIAPVRLEDNAYVAAGTTVTVDLPKNCMCIGRNRETIKENRAKYHKNKFDKTYFGTDGIRGKYGEFLTEKIAYLTGNFLGYSSDLGTIIVGRDTRTSGNSLLDALIEGITDAGATAINLGIVTTPCVAFVTQRQKANYGIMITASHNPADYNGIKIFNYDGRKLTDIEEVEIEKHIKDNKPYLAKQSGLVIDGNNFVNDYQSALCSVCDNLIGLKIVLDCANGAAGRFAKKLFTELGADVVCLNDSTDGSSINDGCGALYPEACAEAVMLNKADIGFSFDGDADRLIAIDENGEILNGDEIVYIIAKNLKENNKLTNNTVVGTVLSNLGYEKSLTKLGIKLIRTDVGDHYVMERMLRQNLAIGGEQSGHVILKEYSNTGDGLLCALYLSGLLSEKRQKMSKQNDCLRYPQFHLDLYTENKNTITNSPILKEYADKITTELHFTGRVLIRASGTESKIRIMTESESYASTMLVADKLKTFIENNFNL